VGEPIADLSAGLYASWAILAALLRRACSGEGAHLDVSMFDCVFSLMPTAVAKWMFTGETLRRVGNRHPLSTPFGAFRAEDGRVVIAVLNDAQFGRLAAAMGRPDLAADPRFGSDTLRTDNEPALRALIESWTRRRPVGEVVAELSAAAVPAAPIASIAEVIESPQVAERGLLLRQMHPRLGETAVMEQPVHFAGLGRGGLAAAPLLGADDVDVLGGLLGLDAAEVAAISRRSA
jgi:CoA:oxalate CoA-transferase